MESGVRKALGKGIEALFPAPQERRVPAAAPNELAGPVHEIVPNPEQPRRHFDDEALGSLADSIRRHRLPQPPVGRRTAGGAAPARARGRSRERGGGWRRATRAPSWRARG